MQRYVLRGFENELIEELESNGVACIVGIPGIGKTTTSKFIAVKMNEEGFIPILLTSSNFVEIESYGRDVFDKDMLDVFRDENGREHELYKIPIQPFSGIDENLAKKMALAIVKVVNTCVDESKLSEKPKEFLKGVCKKLGISDRYLENRSQNLLKIGKIGVEVVSSVILGVGIVSLAKMIKEEFEELKLKARVVVIIDDLAEIYDSSLLTFVDWLRKSGASVLLVRRVNLEKEFLEFSREMDEFKARFVNELLTGSREIHFLKEKQIFPVLTPDFETFREIMKANNVKDGIEELYEISGGLPTLAILMHQMGVSYEDVEKARREYHSIDRIKEKGDPVEMAKSTLNTIISGARVVYEKMTKENFAFVALFVQNVAYEELKKFCEREEIREIAKDNGYKLFPNLDRFRWIAEIYEEELEEGKRKFYLLSENWRHMRLFLDVLCNRDEYIRNEVRIVREVLLDIMTKEAEKTYGMLWYALEHVEWFNSNGVHKLKEALFWGRDALCSMPARGFKFVEIVKDLWRKVKHDDEITLYASDYAWQLVEFGKLMTSNAEKYKKFVELAEKLMKDETDDDAVLCYRAMTYSSIASGLYRFGLEYGYYLKKAKEIIKKIKSKSMVNVASRYVHINKAVIKEKPIENLEKAKDYLKEIEKEGLSEEMKRYLKPLGGEPEKKLRDQLEEWHRTIYFELGRAYKDEDGLDEAKGNFEKALDHSKNVDDKLAIQSYLGRISVIEDYKFKWNVKGKDVTFKDLWETCKENLIGLTSEDIACGCAEYLVSEIVSGKEKIEEEELKYVKLDPDTFSLLNGIACLFGLIDKREAVKELKNLELRKFELKIASANAEGRYHEVLALEKIKDYVKELYDFSIDPSKRRDYEIRKMIEIEIWRERSKVWQITFYSTQALARIMMFYIVKDLEYAKKLAEQESSEYFKLPNRLFKELAKSIEKEIRGDDAKEDVKKAFVKLFYLHV